MSGDATAVVLISRDDLAGEKQPGEDNQVFFVDLNEYWEFPSPLCSYPITQISHEPNVPDAAINSNGRRVAFGALKLAVCGETGGEKEGGKYGEYSGRLRNRPGSRSRRSRSTSIAVTWTATGMWR